MYEDKIEKNITDTNLEEFKKLVRRAVFLTHEEEPLFKAIPNHTWKRIFAVNFAGNFEYARRVLLYQYKEIERIDDANLDREKNKIANLKRATNFIIQAIKNNEKIIFITDSDNDGSLAQAVINEYLTIDKDASKNALIEYTQTVNGNSNRGITVDHVDLIISSKNIDPESEFLIVTADNGINSKEEQKKILTKYPKAKIVITDHHNPDPEMIVEENDRTVIFNPHYKPTNFFKKYNISGANTIGVLLKNVLNKRLTPTELSAYSKNFEKLNMLFKVANLLDYVNTHPADKPEKDYIATKFIQLQPLVNTNNSINKIITGEIPVETIAALKKKISNLNTDLISEEVKNIHTQNTIAKILLNIYKKRDSYTHEDYEELRKKENKRKKIDNNDIDDSTNEKQKDLDKNDFNRIFLQEIKNLNNYIDNSNINPNYIEQLRPIIFSLGVDYNKTSFLEALEQKMIEVFDSIKLSENRIVEELRRGEVITKKRLENSVIVYADPDILNVFNRKFLNKVYNDENPGFSLTLDSIGKDKVSGSFRSLYDISDILKNKARLEKQLRIKIETPGHERAAGFIIKSKNPKKYPIDDNIIEAINIFINNSIENIKKNELDKKDYILADFDAVKIINKINKVIRGNISNFEKINPVIKINKDTIWTDVYTTEQFTMEELINNRKYGYITINTDFDGGTVIIPVEVVRRIVENNYKDYLSLAPVSEGVFIADRIITENQAVNIVDVRIGNNKTKALEEAWESDFKHRNYVELTRDQIADNPFYKYHDYGHLNFALFEKMVIGLIDKNKVDTLTVFDVEANGFGNGKLINIGSMNYSIDPTSGNWTTASDFFEHLYHTSRKEDYLLTEKEVSELKEIDPEEFNEIPIALKKVVLYKYDKDFGVRYFLPKNAEKLTKKKTLPFKQIRNYIETEDGRVNYNREIKATMLAYLVKDKDFRVPQELTNLTGITQELLNKYGRETCIVDKELTEFYKDKKVLFGAHNIPYDARIVRANLPNFYEILKSNKIYDSALFAKKEMLAYDFIEVASIPAFKDITGKEILFYNSAISDFSLTKFIEENKNGYFPDRTNSYLLEIDNGEYYMVDKIKHEKVKLNLTQEELLKSLKNVYSLGSSVQYSVEKMAEQWMIHALLLNDEKFEVELVNLNKPEYKSLRPYADAIKYFQENYHFDISPAKNILNFKTRYMNDVISNPDDEEITPETAELGMLTEEFLKLNKNIAQKFCDAWIYKMVLNIKDPTRKEINNDLIDLVNYQTHIPKEKIRQIFDEAIKFKEKHGIDCVLQHEMHANGPWRTDIKGDIAFEDKLTLTLLANKEYNPYSHDISHALETFLKFQIEARLNFDIADGLSDSLAQDSYSFRQGILYDREVITPTILKIQERERLLKEKGRHIIKFKLGEDILPDKTAIYAVLKDNVTLSREEIEIHKEKLEFIMLNEQLKTSLHNAPANLADILAEIYKANKPKIIEHKLYLNKYYDFIEYNKNDYHIKQFLDKAIEIGIFGKLPKRELKTLILPTVDMQEVLNVKEIVNNMITAASSIKEAISTEIAKQENVAIVEKMINDRLTNPISTKLEIALNNPNKTFSDFENVNEPNFLEEVDIVRKTPIERLLYKHHEFRLLNGIVEKIEKYALENKKENKNRVCL